MGFRNLGRRPGGRGVTVTVNGRKISAREGESLHALLLAHGYRVFGRSPGGRSRGVFCGMGVCYDCLVTIDGRGGQRACMTSVVDNMEIEIDEG